jgi:hypothetical protein
MFFLLNSRFLFYFIYLHCYISIFILLDGVTLWKLVFSYFGFALNPGSYIHMCCYYSPWFFFIGLCFVKYTVLTD